MPSCARSGSACGVEYDEPRRRPLQLRRVRRSATTWRAAGSSRRSAPARTRGDLLARRGSGSDSALGPPARARHPPHGHGSSGRGARAGAGRRRVRPPRREAGAEPQGAPRRRMGKRRRALGVAGGRPCAARRSSPARPGSHPARSSWPRSPGARGWPGASARTTIPEWTRVSARRGMRATPTPAATSPWTVS